MSYLYLGIDPKSQAPLVIKVLSPKHLSSKEMVQRFLKEAEIIRLTDHPNIVKLYGQGEWEHGLYLAMELIRGLSLKQLIMQKTLSTKSSLEIILDVAYALLHLHSHGVIHRDLKPENIMLTEDGKVKVIDFGIAQISRDEELAYPKRSFIGTPNYMSPQQRKDPRKGDPANDIYALGVIAFELLTGKLSNGAMNLSMLPEQLQTLIKKATAHSLEERYHDIVDMITDISACLKEKGSENRAPFQESSQEIWERLCKCHHLLFPQKPPKWHPFAIGYASQDEANDLAAFSEYFHFPNQAYVLAFGASKSASIEGLPLAAFLKGLMLSKSQERAERPFKPLDFVTSLNEIVAKQAETLEFFFQLLTLFPSTNQFSFISCGPGALLHFQGKNSSPHFISQTNPLLGQDPRHFFYETTKSWSEGDHLLLHSFDLSTFSKKEEETKQLMSLISSQNLHLPPEAQAKAFLKKMKEAFPDLKESAFKPTLVIQRIT